MSLFVLSDYLIWLFKVNKTGEESGSAVYFMLFVSDRKTIEAA